jgi:hypothetical protein
MLKFYKIIAMKLGLRKIKIVTNLSSGNEIGLLKDLPN